MSLDFHRLDNNEHLFALTDEQQEHLSEIFHLFYQRTGLEIDPYKDMQLTSENCRTLIQIIDKHVQQSDLNKDKANTIELLGFRGLLDHFSTKAIDLRLRGD